MIAKTKMHSEKRKRMTQNVKIGVNFKMEKVEFNLQKENKKKRNVCSDKHFEIDEWRALCVMHSNTFYVVPVFVCVFHCVYKRDHTQTPARKRERERGKMHSTNNKDDNNDGGSGDDDDAK